MDKTIMQVLADSIFMQQQHVGSGDIGLAAYCCTNTTYGPGA